MTTTICIVSKFLSTLSLRRATANGGDPSSYFGNFYPRSPCGERQPRKTEVPGAIDFYPRSPCGERRWAKTIAAEVSDFYPRSPCGERRVHYDNYNLHCTISIHALLAESDDQTAYFFWQAKEISIHALLAESDSKIDTRRSIKMISIHALLAESDEQSKALKIAAHGISIHALLAESDTPWLARLA